MRLYWNFLLGVWAIGLLGLVGTYCISLLLTDGQREATHHMGIQTSLDEVISTIGEVGIDGLSQKSAKLHPAISLTVRDAENKIAFDREAPARPTTSAWSAPMRIFARRVSEEAQAKDPSGQPFNVRVASQLSPTRSIQSIMHQPALPVGILIFLTAFLSWLYCQYLFKPLRHISDVVSRLAGGQIGARVNHATTDGRGELSRLGADFNSMTDRLEKGFQERERLVREVSLELRRPVQRLKEALEVARIDDTEARFDALNAEVDGIEQVVAHGLAVTGEDDATPSDETESTEVVELVSYIVREIDFEATQESKHVRLHLAAPIWVNANERLLRNAIDNVIRNAVHYTPEKGTVEVSIRADKQPGGDDFVEITVNDEGPTVAEEILKQLFDPRFDIGTTTQPNHDQRRLGLSLAARAVRLHDGAISARNRLGTNGLCIALRLPMADKPAHA